MIAFPDDDDSYALGVDWSTGPDESVGVILNVATGDLLIVPPPRPDETEDEWLKRCWLLARCWGSTH